MAIPFASLESRVNVATVSNLANKTLKIDFVDVDGIFDDSYAEVGFVETSNPIFETLTANIPEVTQGVTALDEVTGKEWEIIGVENDGTGMTKLELRVKWYE